MKLNYYLKNILDMQRCKFHHCCTYILKINENTSNIFFLQRIALEYLLNEKCILTFKMMKTTYLFLIQYNKFECFARI